MALKFIGIGNKIIESEYIESIEPYDEYNSPDIKIIMASGKKHIISYDSPDERTAALEDLSESLSPAGTINDGLR